MAGFSPNQVHIDQALTNLAIAYIQDDLQFVADKVFPTLQVAKQSDSYWIWDSGSFLRGTAMPRAPSTRAAQKTMKLSQDQYQILVHAVEQAISVEANANVDDGLNLDQAALNSVMVDLLITRERMFIADFMKTTVWGTDITGVAAAPSAVQTIQWSDYANSDPIADIELGKLVIQAATGIMPNTLTVSPAVHSVLKQHPVLKEYFKYTSSESLTEVMIARLFGLERYLVAAAVAATSAEGAATFTADFMMGKDALLTYSPVSLPSAMTPVAGVTFAWTFPYGTTSERGIAIDRYFEENILTEWVRGHLAQDQKVTAPLLGRFYDSIVA